MLVQILMVFKWSKYFERWKNGEKFRKIRKQKMLNLKGIVIEDDGLLGKYGEDLSMKIG